MPDSAAERIVAIEQQIVALDRLLQSRSDAHGREHAMLQSAVDEFKAYLHAKLAEMNEVRAQINQERGMYPTHSVLDAKVSALQAQIATVDASLQSRVKALELLLSNFQGRLWMLGAALTGLMLIFKIFWKT